MHEEYWNIPMTSISRQAAGGVGPTLPVVYTVCGTARCHRPGETSAEWTASGDTA